MRKHVSVEQTWILSLGNTSFSVLGSSLGFNELSFFTLLRVLDFCVSISWPIWLGFKLPGQDHSPEYRLALVLSLIVRSGVPGGSDSKESACSEGDPGSITGSGRCPGEGSGDPLQCSCLEKPMDRGAWWGYSPWSHKELDAPEWLTLSLSCDHWYTGGEERQIPCPLWLWQFSSVAQSCPTVTLWTEAHQASLSIINSRSLLRLMSVESVMPSKHLILCRPLLLPSIFPSIRVFSNESALRIRWPMCWSFSFNISPSNEHSGPWQRKSNSWQLSCMLWIGPLHVWCWGKLPLGADMFWLLCYS